MLTGVLGYGSALFICAVQTLPRYNLDISTIICL